ncbi:MAG: hypothetical protein M1834_000979 [Cirrosporium novae-zelandiae]|nr:MAG: hypothetical protein M1834_000979 [Cirrosporium novae-zelandiae]
MKGAQTDGTRNPSQLILSPVPSAQKISRSPSSTLHFNILQLTPLTPHSSWDNAYANELHNYSTNPDDEGTIWFSDCAAEEKVMMFLEEKLEEKKQQENASGTEKNKGQEKDMTILDLGTGNGHMLFSLLESETFTGAKMVGVDYSARSVELARQIKLGKENEGINTRNLQFAKWDFLSRKAAAAAAEWFPHDQGGFDIVLDKGTFDAISLSGETDQQGKRIVEGYKGRVEELVRRGGMLLITSCNWTEEELVGWVGGGRLVVEGRVRYPRWRFGGKEGQSVVSVCFRRRG